MRHTAQQTTARPVPGPLTSHGALWPETLPMALDAPMDLPEPGPFREALQGLHVRELPDEALFQSLFGQRY